MVLALRIFYAIFESDNTLKRRCIVMIIEVSQTERDLLKKILESYLSELRLEVAATKRGTSSLHEEEGLVGGLLKRVSELK
jgi:hypothetical protein